MTESHNQARYSILVGLDDSESSWKALDEALTHARLKQAIVHIVSVQEEIKDSYSASEVLAAQKTGQDTLEKAQTKARLKAEKIGLAVRTALLRDSSAGAIIRYARENKIDLIVIGDRGHMGLLENLLGNTADKIVRMATCSVLIVR